MSKMNDMGDYLMSQSIKMYCKRGLRAQPTSQIGDGTEAEVRPRVRYVQYCKMWVQSMSQISKLFCTIRCRFSP